MAGKTFKFLFKLAKKGKVLLQKSFLLPRGKRVTTS